MVTSLLIGFLFVYKIFFVPHGIDIDKQKYPVTGIDISAHTGKIDFTKIKIKILISYI